MTLITVVNHSTLVSNVQVQTMVRAVAYQLNYDAAPAWRITPMAVVYAQSEATAPPGSWVIGVLDNADQVGDLGWHSEQNGVAYGRVFAQPVFSNGGDALSKPLSVASVLSHEVLETFVDPACNLYADRGDGIAVAREVGDPVESDSYIIKVDSTPVTVSNFVTPAWFDPQATGQKFDYLGRCTKPFQMTRGGYEIQVREGTVSSVFGDEYPAWRKTTKQSPLSRTSRRLSRTIPLTPGQAPERKPSFLDKLLGS